MSEAWRVFLQSFNLRSFGEGGQAQIVLSITSVAVQV